MTTLIAKRPLTQVERNVNLAMAALFLEDFLADETIDYITRNLAGEAKTKLLGAMDRMTQKWDA